MARLSVNVNKVATLRNTRAVGIPSVVRAARIALDAGAHGITIHPRPDERHIRATDVYELAAMLKAGYPGAELNIEGNPFHNYLTFAHDVRPAQCTLVPDEPAAATSDHGWDLRRDGDRLRPVIAELQSLGCRVSLFMDAQVEAIEQAAALRVERVELYTAPYAEAFARGDPAAVDACIAAARRAAALGLAVNAGHDLNLPNLAHLVRHVPQAAEVSIGHALIADAMERGLAETVRQYVRAAAGVAAGPTSR